MTLPIFNRYVDSATGVSKTGCLCEQPGSLVVGDQVLYWAEDLKRKPFKAKGKHRAERRRVFFLRRLFTPRKFLDLRKQFKLFGGWS
jgi:hypothetical protein